MKKNNSSLNIIVVWEQNDWGGVDSYLNYLLTDWPSTNDTFTIVYNRKNKGAERLKQLLKNRDRIKFIEKHSIFEDSNRNTLFYKLGKILKYTATPLLFIFSALSYKWLFIKLKPDVILAQNGGYPGSYGNISSLFGAFFAKVPVRTLVIHHAATKPNFLHTWFRQIMEKSLSKKITGLIAVSRVTKETIIMNTRIVDDQHCHIVVIDNGIPITKKSIKINKNKLSDIFTIGVVGRLDSFKGHDDLLCALSLLSEDYLKKIKVRFIGGYDSRDYGRLTKLIKSLNLDDIVKIDGYIDEEIPKIVNQLDLLAMTTKTFEGFGLTIVEALHNNIPVLATRVGVVDEIFPKESPLVIDAGDIHSMSAAIMSFVDKNNKSNFIPKSVRDKMWKYDSKVMSKKYRENLFFEYVKHTSSS